MSWKDLKRYECVTSLVIEIGLFVLVLCYSAQSFLLLIYGLVTSCKNTHTNGILAISQSVQKKSLCF